MGVVDFVGIKSHLSDVIAKHERHGNAFYRTLPVLLELELASKYDCI